MANIIPMMNIKIYQQETWIWIREAHTALTRVASELEGHQHSIYPLPRRWIPTTHKWTIYETVLKRRLRQTAHVRFAFMFSRKISTREYFKLILAFDASAKLSNFTEKLKTASGKWRINMVTWSFLPFAVNVTLNLSIVLRYKTVRRKQKTKQNKTNWQKRFLARALSPITVWVHIVRQRLH